MSLPPRTLTRAQFENACKKYIDSKSSPLLAHSPTGWEWREDHTRVGLAYMHRQLTMQVKASAPMEQYLEDEIETLEDDADDPASTCIPSTPAFTVVIEQYVVFSPSYQVPGFMFNAYDSGGTPITLEKLAASSFLRLKSSLPTSTTSEVQSIIIAPEDSTNEAPFPLLTQSEHPILGIPCWSIHPCETSPVMGELLDETIGVSWNEDDPQKGLVRWLATWFMLLSTIVDIVSL